MALSVITESDNMSDTLTSPSSLGSGPSPGSVSTQTTASGSPLMQHHQLTSTTLASTTTLTNGVNGVEGWPRVAKLMTEIPDFEAFSRFRELNVKNLLYYQVELAVLEKKLTEAEQLDASKSSREKRYAKFANRLIESQKFEPGSPLRMQWDLVCKIRECLKEYNAALLQHQQISALPHPESRNVDSLRIWLQRPECGNYCISGPGAHAWGHLFQVEAEPKGIIEHFFLLLRSIVWAPSQAPTEALEELVTTHPHQENDGLTHWIFKEWIPFYHTCRKSKKKQRGSGNGGRKDEEKTPGLQEVLSIGTEDKPQDAQIPGSQDLESFAKYSNSVILKFTSAVATVVSCVLPTLAIGILTTAQGNLQKLLYIGGFTMLFAIGLMWLTDAGTSRVQVFTATAAFSAVLVVFVQNQ